jgi:transcriptional regulator with XRE-family HTH domain
MSLIDKTEIGKRLIMLQQQLGLNSRQFAMGAALDVSYLGKIEKGEKPLSGNYLQRIEKKYNANKDWIITGKGEMFIPNAPQREPQQPGAEDTEKRLSLERSIQNLTQNELRTTAVLERLVSLLEMQYSKESKMDLGEPGGKHQSTITKNTVDNIEKK